MTPQDLMAAVETLAEAPEGITRLKELVLQLAVRGKLVPQDPDDEPASVLLERIAVEKARLVKEGKIRKPKPLPPVSDDEVPFEVPEGWEWCRLCNVTETQTGTTPKKALAAQDGPTIPYLKPAHIGSMWADHSNRIARVAADNTGRIAPAGSTLFVGIGGSIGKCGLANVDVTFNQQVHAATPLLASPRFLLMSLASRDFQRRTAELTSSTAIPIINKSRWERIPIPLPPLDEQHRIVAKVDELMGLLDRLEAARTKREATRIALRDAALAALRDSDTHKDVEVAWNRIAARMDDLFTDPADVDPLRQTVLQLAVRGRLVPQDPEDEPASVLLERIAEEKARLVKEGKIRKPKPLPPVSADEVPFEVPEGWEWCRFGTVTESRLGKMLDKAKNTGTLRSYIRNANLQWFQFVLDDLKRLRLEDEQLDDCTLAAGDLVICEGGEPGRAAVCDNSVAEMVYQKAIHRARPYGCVTSWYLAYILRCDAWSGRLSELFTGATIKHLTGKSLASYTIPLPPLAEQHRIVAKVDELMDLLDKLEQRLTAKTTLHNAFAAAAVHHLDAMSVAKIGHDRLDKSKTAS